MSSPSSARLPIGVSDFREIRERGMLYVDKTPFIEDVLASGAKAILFPRPRRFGKTLNLSTLRCFLEKSDEDPARWFEGLSVWRSDMARAHAGRYPVISLSFKDVKAGDFATALEQIRREISGALRGHEYLLTSAPNPWNREHLEQLFRGEGSEGLFSSTLRFVSEQLQRHHGQQVFLLIDEYDTPIHSAGSPEELRKIIGFFRSFLSAGLKDNPHLAKGILTGILRVAKENLFSGLNHLAVYSLLRPESATAFGFTPDEVRDLCDRTGNTAHFPNMESWYNGYRFGGHVIYNPWSVVSFLDSEDKVLRPYWVNTSSDDLLRRAIFAHGIGSGTELDALVAGGQVDKGVDEGVALREMEQDSELVWSFLLFTGYLKANRTWQDGGTTMASLSIPNREVAHVYRTIFQGWLRQRLGGSGQVTALHEALLSANEEACSSLLTDLLASASVHDFAEDPGGMAQGVSDGARARRTPERIYHALVLGLVLGLQPRWQVRSNRESGTGRYDVMLLPTEAGKPGVLLELKVRNRKKRESLESVFSNGLKQLRERDYAAELRAAGAAPIHEIVIVFDEKEAHVRVARPRRARAPRRPAARNVRRATAKRKA